MRIFYLKINFDKNLYVLSIKKFTFLTLFQFIKYFILEIFFLKNISIKLLSFCTPFLLMSFNDKLIFIKKIKIFIFQIRNSSVIREFTIYEILKL